MGQSKNYRSDWLGQLWKSRALLTLTLRGALLILPLQPISPQPSFNNSYPLKSVPSLKSLEGSLLLMRQSQTTVSMTLKLPLYGPHPTFLTSFPDLAQQVHFVLLTWGYWSSLNLRTCDCASGPLLLTLPIFSLFDSGYPNGYHGSHCSFD